MSHKKIDNNLVTKHKSELTLKLNKSAYVGMCILSYWCTNSIMITLKKNKTTNWNYYAQTLIDECIKLKLDMYMKMLAAIKKCMALVIIKLR